MAGSQWSYRRKVQQDALGKVNRVKETRRRGKDGLKNNRQQHFVRKKVWWYVAYNDITIQPNCIFLYNSSYVTYHWCDCNSANFYNNFHVTYHWCDRNSTNLYNFVQHIMIRSTNSRCTIISRICCDKIKFWWWIVATTVDVSPTNESKLFMMIWH